VAGGRRASYYGDRSASSGSGYEEKLRHASTYQELTGGTGLPLTEESLRHAGRAGGSSRSSGSHDESDYRQSATTRTTRSSGNNDPEDVTIRIKNGGAILEVGGAKMKCRDGAEINITSSKQQAGLAHLRGVPALGSDKSSYLDHDDRRGRADSGRSVARTRASSQAPAALSRYAASPGGYYYDNTPAPPPYPQYPATGYEEEDYHYY